MGEKFRIANEVSENIRSVEKALASIEQYALASRAKELRSDVESIPASQLGGSAFFNSNKGVSHED